MPLVNTTCDTRKGDSIIKYNPASGTFDHEAKIKFKSSGQVESTDNDFDEHINKILNLNSPRLVKNRVIVLEEVQSFLSRKKGRRNKKQIQRLIDHWESKVNGMHKEYFGVATYDLNIRKDRAPE